MVNERLVNGERIRWPFTGPGPLRRFDTAGYRDQELLIDSLKNLIENSI